MFSLRVMRAKCWFALACGFLLCLPAPPPPVSAQANVSNFITIREKAGVTTTNYPVQIARPFAPGEIKKFPRAVVNGVALTTQADVKARWADGTVKHAVLEFYLPTLVANSTVTVIFTNQASGLNASPLTKAAMLGKGFNFNAHMELSRMGTITSAAARDMLNADQFTYWNQGTVATSIILADHSLARTFDMGFDSNRSVRPIFHATFWPLVNKVKVRFIGEVANTVALQDQTYALSLKLQNLNPINVYSKASFTHPAATRWTKEFWIGGAPPKIDINHNLEYLRQTTAVPNFDTSHVISEAALHAAYASNLDSWTNASKDIFDSGNLFKLMPTAGGRDEIGPYPTWVVRWLYTGDARMCEQTVGNAELSAAFPIHFREGLDGRQFDRLNVNGAPPALGKILSLSARPTVFLHRGNAYIDYFYTETPDKIVPLNGTSLQDDEWLPDCAHQPDYHSVLYTLTGDYFFLEEMNFWASWSAASANFTNAYWWGRGPTGDTGGIIDEVRGDGWILRNRAQAAFLNPDGSPEKNYFTRLTHDAIAVWEGTLGLTGTPNEGTPNYVWGATTARKKFSDKMPHPTELPPLGYWEEGHAVGSWSEIVDYNKAEIEASPWMHFILVYGLGRAKELGFSTGPVLGYASKVVNRSLTNTNYNPYLTTAYQMPTVKRVDDAFYASYLDERKSYLATFDPMPGFYEQLQDGNHGYAFLLMAATAMTRREAAGSQAWSFVQQNIQPAAALHDNPKWAILPR